MRPPRRPIVFSITAIELLTFGLSCWAVGLLIGLVLGHIKQADERHEPIQVLPAPADSKFSIY
jgi:hypothetical protein